MGDWLSISFSSPLLLAIALAMSALVIILATMRRLDFPRLGWIAGVIGLALLSLATGGAIWHRPTGAEIAVMVDLSPSTRGAHYRERATLEARVRQLLGRAPYRVYYFANDISSTPQNGPRLGDLATDRTVYDPPAATAVLLFSDAQFALPMSAPPTFVVIDPGLESPNDAAVTNLDIKENQVSTEVKNSGPPRTITFSGVANERSATSLPGAYTFARQIEPGANTVVARLAPGDAWPENDQLAAMVPPPPRFERWRVGNPTSIPGWRTMTPAALPADPAAFLRPGVIILDNIAASDLSALQQQRLAQYVRDLGGTLLILGGDRAFAAGSYAGTTLENLSPLASTPPQPTSHWIILVDSSGSMATVEGAASRWQYVGDAVLRLVPRLPPDDLLSVGSFAQDLTWWTSRRSVRQTIGMPLPPPDVFPHGPTNLDFALRELARINDGAMPTRLLLLTDADAQIDQPAALADALKQRQIRVHLLAIGNGSGLPALRAIVQTTGGSMIQQSDPRQWLAAAQDLMRAASPDLLVSKEIEIRFAGTFSSLPERRAGMWNRTWLKNSATMVAQGKDDQQESILGGLWNQGQGRVAALAFPMDAAALEPVVAQLQRPPRDPRFRVSWQTGPRLHVKVEAMDAAHYLNGSDLHLQLARDLEDITAAASIQIPQTAPGEYEIDIDAPRSATFAAVQSNKELLERIAIAGRYAPEFDAIGNDQAAMQQLADRTGGKVILPNQTYAIDFPRPRRPVNLTPLLAMLGAAFIALAIVLWRIA